MRVLIVSTSDMQYGAFRAAYRLHKSLLAEDIDSQMLVQNKYSDDWKVTSYSSKIGKFTGNVKPFLDVIPAKFYKNKTQTLFSPSWIPSPGIVKKINQMNPDIVHLHWICGGMLRIEDLAKIKAPIVWSLHDMWAFTGGCHYDEFCGAYQNDCGNCLVLRSHKKNDLSKKVFKRKQKTYSKLNNITIVGLSSWIADCAKKSTLLKSKKVVNLPNPIDTNIFKPFDKEISRELWNMPKNKRLLLFGATSATSDPRKGFTQLVDALKILEYRNMECVIFGSNEPKDPPDFGFKIHYLGYVHDDISLRVLYSMADVMVVPSLQENLGQTVIEPMACGVPVVAFSTTGMLDIIDHKKNGYLAKASDPDDLANGIEWILNYDKYDMLSQNAREKVLRNFDSEVVARKYIKLYKGLLL